MEKPNGKFDCPNCNSTFTEKGSLTRHLKNLHSSSSSKSPKKSNGQFPCSFCSATFTTNGNLQRHCKQKHVSENNESVEYSCPACSESFNRQDNLTRHFNSKHKGKSGTCKECNEIFSDLRTLTKHLQEHQESSKKKNEESTKNFQCYLCDKNFTLQQNLNTHLERFHQISCKRAPSKLCPLCDEAFQNLVLLDKHLENNHSIHLETSDEVFNYTEEFKHRKCAIEEEDLAFFSFKASTENRTYYECHRSGKIETNNSSTQFQWKQTSKIGKSCPARIVATVIDGRIHVHFQRTHVGHTQTIQHLRLTKQERDELAGKLSMGVTPDRILDDIRESVASLDCVKRIHLVDKRDLYNILRDYKLDRDVVHKNDAFSVEMWVQGQMSLGENSPVAYFKMQGYTDKGNLLKEDFMIVLMTPYQRDVISQYATDKVCVDSTHKPTDHDFQLTSIVTVDEFGAGCPVAFCLSNRIDGVAMANFFEAVKKKVGQINADTFMSDDAPAYINAWTEVMSKPQHHLICNWHIDKNWRKNLNKIKNILKHPEVYKACRMLMECLDKDKFHDCMDGFVLMCEEDPDTRDFGQYFKKYYAKRPEQWAFCYRIGLSLNTNMYLEALHKKIKYCYMQGRQNRRVDKCISLLIRFARDMMFYRTIRMIKNKPTYRMEQTAHSHRRSENISDSMMEQVDESTWIVQSTTLGRGPYTVSIDSSMKCSGCPLSCQKCGICVHKFTCTCIDFLIKGNFCKHVHACVRLSNGKVLSKLVNEEEITSAVELHNEQIIESLQGKSVHVRDSVTTLVRLKTLANVILGIADITSEEGLLKVVARLESAVDLMKQNPIDHADELLSTPHFPELPSNLPSHKNIEKQDKFRSTRKQRVSEARISKPTDMEKASYVEVIKNSSRKTEVVSVDFDHNYDPLMKPM